MNTPSPGLPLFVDRHGPIIADMVDRGLRPDQIRRRFHLLHPQESPSLLNEMLNRLAPPYSIQEATAMATHYTDAQIRVGVEVVVFQDAGLPHDFDAACLLDEATFQAIEQLTSTYDPSGASTRNLLGAIAAVRQAVAGGQKFRLQPSTYEQVRSRLGSDVGLTDAPAWPVPWTEVAYRMGNGLWNCAIRSMGLESTSGTRTTLPCGQVTPEARDAAAEVREIHDPGIGLIAPQIPADQIPEAVWDNLRDLLADDLATLPWKSQLVLKYLADGTGNTPSAWAGAGPDGVTCAMSTTVTVPVSHWPLDVAYFDEGHWDEPTSWDSPWTAGPLEPVTAAERMVDGLRFGRLCPDPYSFRWGTTVAATAQAPVEQSSGEVIPLRSS
ncbi:hypothetical protein [Kocuria sp.]|uniref:hypothetical protein n=1 Tax=Kocuria sp. TaxID=1871328 RepID=UPI0026E020A4|nr:hypothetical protein [Kocuria sp.]MDO5617589.1 hypothetical protein [Kocuria sp.]